MVASYLLNVKGIRVANALNKMNTLRVQPPLNVTQEQCDIFLAAFKCFSPPGRACSLFIVVILIDEANHCHQGRPGAAKE